MLGRTSYQRFSSYCAGVADHPGESASNRAYREEHRCLD